MKILVCLPGMGTGGIESFLRDQLVFSENTIEYTFVGLSKNTTSFSQSLNKYGDVHIYKGWSFKFLVELYKLIKKNKYDIVHSHMGNYSWITSMIAFGGGIKIRIAHSHSADNWKSVKGKNKMIFVLSIFLNKIFCNYFFACSQHAGILTFGEKIVKRKNFFIIPNPVNMSKFEMSTQNDEEELKKELGIPIESKLVGHIGYFGTHKNHDFIINLAEKLKDQNIYWLLIGDGSKKQAYAQKISDKGLKKIILTGIRTDIPELINIMDLFILPSLMEGLGTVVLEAQASSKNCLVSENVTKEIDVGLGLVKHIPLDNEQKWIDEIVNFKPKQKIAQENIKLAFKKKLYDGETSMRMLINLYKEILIEERGIKNLHR